jgi:hypothetical protein
MKRKPAAKGTKRDSSSTKPLEDMLDEELPKTLDSYGKVLGEGLDDCLDRMEEALRAKLHMLTVVLGSATRARRMVLGHPPTPRELAAGLALIGRKPTPENLAALRAELDRMLPTPRDRAVYEALLKQKPSARGNNTGRRKSVETALADNELLRVHGDWKAARQAASTDRGFACWWYKRETGKAATDKDIRRIAKRLRDARRRVEQQSS